jgi:hypothetical protein
MNPVIESLRLEVARLTAELGEKQAECDALRQELADAQADSKSADAQRGDADEDLCAYRAKFDTIEHGLGVLCETLRGELAYSDGVDGEDPDILCDVFAQMVELHLWRGPNPKGME